MLGIFANTFMIATRLDKSEAVVPPRSRRPGWIARTFRRIG